MTEGLLSRNINKMQLVTEFIIPKFTEGSTYNDACPVQAILGSQLADANLSEHKASLTI
jgi:hypothetical protein